MSPRSEQNGVSPDYVSMSCVDNSSDLFLNKNNSTASSTEKSGRGGCFYDVDDKMKFIINDVAIIVAGIFTLLYLRRFWKSINDSSILCFGSVDGSLVV